MCRENLFNSRGPRKINDFVGDLLLQPFIAFGGQMGADALEELDQKYQEDDGHYHYKILIAVIAVVYGDLAEAAAADHA